MSTVTRPSIGHGPLAEATLRSPAPRIPRARTTWWPRRRVEPEPVAIGYESGWMPGSFETVDTLGDTRPAELDGSAGLEQTTPYFKTALIAVIALAAFVAVVL